MMMDKSQFQSTLAVSKHRHINKLLNPLFKTIKTKKINSFYQLKHHQVPEHSQFIFNTSKELPLQADRVLSRIAKTSEKKKKMEIAHPATADNIKRLNENQKHDSKRNKKDFLISKSKIKSHLIESIDYEEIEEKLFKKRKWRTLYEQFCDQLQTRKPMQREKKCSSLRKNRDLSPELVKNYDTICTRRTQKKKFWIRQVERSNPENNSFVYGIPLKSK